MLRRALYCIAKFLPVHKVGCASLAIMTMRVKATTTTDRKTDIRRPQYDPSARKVSQCPAGEAHPIYYSHQSIYPLVYPTTSTMHYSKAPYCKTISKTMYHIITRPGGAGHHIIMYLYHHIIGFSILRKKKLSSTVPTYLRKSNLDGKNLIKSIKKDGEKKKRGIKKKNQCRTTTTTTTILSLFSYIPHHRL